MFEIISVRSITGHDGFFNYPSGICLHSDSNLFYIADMHNKRICWLTEDGSVGALSNIVDDHSCVSLGRPLAVWVTKQGTLFTADAEHNKIFYKNRQDDVWKPICMDSKFAFNLPGGVAVDENGNVYTNDFLNNRLVRITTEGKVTTLLEGDENLKKPYGIFYKNKRLYFTDTENGRICYISLIDGHTHVFEPQIETKNLYTPIALTLDEEGNIYICEQRNMYFLDVKKNTLSLALDRDIWKEQMFKHSIKYKICHMGALTVKRKGEIYWVDTLKGCVYQMILNIP